MDRLVHPCGYTGWATDSGQEGRDWSERTLAVSLPIREQPSRELIQNLGPCADPGRTREVAGADRGGREHADGAREHGGAVGEDVAEDVACG